MNSDIRVATDFPHSKKLRALEKVAGELAGWHLICLWCWAGLNRPDGDLEGMSDLEIAAACRCQDLAFVGHLRDLGWIDEDGKIHDWDDHQPYATHAKDRKAQAKKAADARWKRRRDAESRAVSNAPGNAESNAPSNAASNAQRIESASRDAPGDADPMLPAMQGASCSEQCPGSGSGSGSDSGSRANARGRPRPRDSANPALAPPDRRDEQARSPDEALRRWRFTRTGALAGAIAAELGCDFRGRAVPLATAALQQITRIPDHDPSPTAPGDWAPSRDLVAAAIIGGVES